MRDTAWVREYKARKLAYTEAMLDRMYHAEDGECNSCAAFPYTGRVCPEKARLQEAEEAAERALDEWCIGGGYGHADRAT